MDYRRLALLLLLLITGLWLITLCAVGVPLAHGEVVADPHQSAVIGPPRYAVSPITVEPAVTYTDRNAEVAAEMRVAQAADAAAADEDLAGPLKIVIDDARRCSALGLTAPCSIACGRLAYKSVRKLWTLRGCDALAGLFLPQPTPRPTAAPTRVPTARPSPTEKVCAAPCCVHWTTGKCTCPCPDS